MSDASTRAGNRSERLSEVPSLSEDSVHLWYASLDRPAQDFVGLLSDGECRRANRFVFERDRRRFVVARGLLRILLARYLVREPEDIVFRYDDGGRPLLETAPGRDELIFNVSHSFEQATFAVSDNSRIAVDIEYVRPIQEVEAIIQDAFSTREQAKWRALPEDQQLEAFFRAWTRKEAYLKAVGVGLSYPLHRLEVGFAPGDSMRLPRIDNDSQQVSEWSLVELRPTGDYIGTLAVEGSNWKLWCCSKPGVRVFDVMKQTGEA